MKEDIIKFYELIFGIVTGNRAYEFKPTKTQHKQIENFIDFLDKKVGIESIDTEFFFYFLCFQYERKKDSKTKFGVGKVPLNNIIGPKSFERWERKSDNWKYWTDKFISDYKIPKPIKEIVNSPKNVLNHFEEVLKQNFWGTDELFFHCSNVTSLYNEASEYCVKCPFKDDCKHIKENS